MPEPAFGPGPVISIGECMVELARGDDGRFGLAFGGDTFNTAVYLARCGVRVDYLTRLGTDPYSDGIVALAAEEGVGTRLVSRVAGRMPGLYLIETTTEGERTFHYWRERAPVRELFDAGRPDALTAACGGAALIYLSGITLSLFAPPALEHLAGLLTHARASGGRVAFDGNFRPRGWAGDHDRARATFTRFLRLTDIALPTFEDEAALWGDSSPQGTVTRLRDLGIEESAVKLGADGVLLSSQGQTQSVPVPACVRAVDTTAAGDSFNAGYLASRLLGHAPAAAALAGHRLAGAVIGHRGAIVPREATAHATVTRP
jgi:2-dehydro-3-deoxygluconokinase